MVQVVDGAEVVVQMLLVQTCSPRELQTQVLQSTVDTWPGVQDVEGATVVVVVVVVEDVPQVLVVQTGSPSAAHTHVLQSKVYDVPGVQLLPAEPPSAGQDEGQYP